MWNIPNQNRLDDLSTLLKFIRAHPYHEPKNFKADISHPWKSGDEEKAVSRLKYLSASLVLRRPKTTISLPARRDLQCPINFNAEERIAYDRVRGQAIIRIDEALHASSDTSKGIAYVSILQQIESLRLICDLGLHYHSRHEDSGTRPQEDWASMAQPTFNAQREIAAMKCLNCSSSIGITEALLNVTDHEKQDGYFFQCLRFCCGECAENMRKLKREISCRHNPTCPQAVVSLVGRATEEVPSSGALGALRSHAGVELSSKIQALVTDVKSLPLDTKW